MGSLRRQSLLMTAMTLAICMAIGVAIMQYVMDRSMREFEGRDAERTLDRISILLNLQLVNMRKQATDYAVWNTTYDFMANGDSTYVSENYSMAILDNLDVDYAFLIRPDGHIAMSLIRASQIAPGATGMHYTSNAKSMLLSNHITELTSQIKESKVASIFSVNGKQYLYGVSAILRNDGTGPSRGNVVFIRTLDNKRMEYLKRLAQVDFVISTVLAKNKIKIDQDRVISAKTIMDTEDNPIAEIIVEQPRPLKQLISTTRNIISAYALIIIMIALLFIFFMFDRLVLRKIDALVKNIFNIRQVGAIGKRLPTIGSQDIDRISSEVNHMLEDLSISHAKLQYEAFHDHLTGLGNRRLLLKELDNSLQELQLNQSEGFILCLMDLDDFKDINDLHGHLAGDQVLKVIALRLLECFRNPDLAVRLGGDEFAVLIRSNNLTETKQFADQLLENVTRPIIWEGISLRVKASIGIVVMKSDLALNLRPIDLVRKADIAMYACKQQGKFGYVIFHDELEQKQTERKNLETELSLMLATKSFSLAFQPIVRINNEQPFAVEALCRWQHPILGMIPPDVFIPIAESTNQIANLDKAMIKSACAELINLRKLLPELQMSVNLSVNTLMNVDITHFIQATLREYGLETQCLMLEITESALAIDESRMSAVIHDLINAGFKILIDDFGTGYSSLSRLNSLPLSYVKIDKSFLNALDDGDKSLCSFIVNIAHNLKMQVIAEGVENKRQLELLDAMGCDFAQGFYLAKPMNIDQLNHYISTLLNH